MRVSVIVDTGPLVAYLNRRDFHHEWAVAQFKRLPPPLRTCEAVLLEAMFLLQDDVGDGSPVLDLLVNGIVLIDFRLPDDAAVVLSLVRKYRDVPMSLTDACLVRMSELHTDCRVLTTDSDFLVYRRHGRGVIPVCMPGRDS